MVIKKINLPTNQDIYKKMETTARIGLKVYINTHLGIFIGCRPVANPLGIDIVPIVDKFVERGKLIHVGVFGSVLYAPYCRAEMGVIN